jgi:S-formylglutathione hydrolase FrmB
MILSLLQYFVSFSFGINPCVGLPELSSVLARSYDQTQAVQACFRSQALGSQVHVEVVVPQGYPFVEPIPVVYFLHGRGNNGEHFKKVGGVEALKSHIDSGGFPLLVVSPSETMHSYWKNRADHRANTADMVVIDLTHYIETHGQVIKDPSMRGVAGISMGGHGALYLGCKDNGRAFGRVHAISPVIRDFDSLKPHDIPVFRGASSGGELSMTQQQRNFNYRDPRFLYTSVLPTQKPNLPCDYQIDYARNDPFIIEHTNTIDFLSRVGRDHPQRVSVKATGGHGARYWRACLPSVLAGMEKAFYGRLPASVKERLKPQNKKSRPQPAF